jgi:hypothetical protein
MQLPWQIQQQAYNPSVVRLSETERARIGCTSCSFVASVRVDWVTQCTGFTKLLKERQVGARYTKFGVRKGTLVMLLDSNWLPTHWGWLGLAEELPRPHRHLEERAMPARARRATSALPHNISAAWLLHKRKLASMADLVDVRLLVLSGQLYTLGSVAAKGYVAQLAPLHLSLGRRSGLPSGAPAELFANIRRNETILLQHNRCAGRSQSFFEWNDTISGRARKTGPAVRLLFQTWLTPGVTCELRHGHGSNHQPAGAAERTTADQPLFVGLGLRNVARGLCVQHHQTSAARERNSAAACRLSLNGVSVRLSDGRILGVGHLHRGFRDTLDRVQLPLNLTYFAHHYTHFFYVQEATPPFFISMLSSEFCIGSLRAGVSTPANSSMAAGTAASEAGLDCEVVQYVTGMVLLNDTLTLSYGINDCTSKLVDLSLQTILDDLRPLSALTHTEPSVALTR